MNPSDSHTCKTETQRTEHLLLSSEVCPNCGDFYDPGEISETTGWCVNCSPATILESATERFLADNADHIEHYIVQGHTSAQAIALLRLERQSVCLSCGALIQRGPRNSVFCRRNRVCRKFSRRYVYLYRELGLSKSEALATVLKDL